MKSVFAAVSVMALAAGACVELPAESNVVDLRVLGVKCEPAGFLVNLADPGAVDQIANITALVVDPTGAGQEVQVSAVGCPDYIDTITSATLQGSKLCPPESATSMFPPPIGPLLTTTTIIPPDMPTSFPPTQALDFQWEPTISFGLRQDQVRAFFSPEPTGIPALDETVRNNRDFGLPAIVNLTFTLNGQTAVAIKRVVYWPQLEDMQEPNTNPTLGDPADPAAPEIRFYAHRDDATGIPDQPFSDDPTVLPMISIANGDKLYVEPNYLPAAVDENYPLIVQEVVDGALVRTKKTIEKELIRFQFYATAGHFDPELQFSELNPVLVGGTLHTDAEWLPPTAADLEKKPLPSGGGIITVWIVTHDERAGTDWASRQFILVP